MRKLSLVVLSGLFAVAANAGEVYKWVDKDGRVHYGDRPKNPQAAEVVTSQPGQGGTPTDPEAEKLAAERRAACEAKRKTLESYQGATVIKETDSLGRERELTPDEHQKLIALTRQQADQVCGPAPPPPPAAETAAADEPEADIEPVEDEDASDEPDPFADDEDEDEAEAPSEW